MEAHHFTEKKIKSAFEKLVKSENPLEQIQIAYKIGNLHPKFEALSALIKALIIPDVDVKLTILDILMQPEFFDARIVGPLCEQLDNDDIEVRKQTVEMLGATKDSKALPYLIKLLKDSDPDVRHCTMAALANLGDKEALQDLIKIFDSDRNWEDKYYAIDAIGMFGEFSTVPVFLKAFQDPHPSVRENAALSVGHLKNLPIKNGLLNLMNDDSVNVQGAAAYTLGDFKYKKAVKYLLDFLKSKDEDLILISIEALGKIQDPTTLPALIKMLDYPIFGISIAAQEALDGFRNFAIIEPLVEALREDVIVKYIEHRLKKFPGSSKNNSNNNFINNNNLNKNLDFYFKKFRFLLQEILINEEEKRKTNN